MVDIRRRLLPTEDDTARFDKGAAERNELAALVDNVRDGKGPFIHIEFDSKETVTADVKKASDKALDGNGDFKYDVPNDKLVEVVKRITREGQEFHRLLQLPEFAEHREKLEQAVKDATVGTKWKAVGRSRPATDNEIECPALAAALKSKEFVREHEANEKVDVKVKVFSKEEVDTFGLITSDSVIKAGDEYYRQAAYGRQLRTLLAAWTAPAFVCRNGI